MILIVIRTPESTVVKRWHIAITAACAFAALAAIGTPLHAQRDPVRFPALGPAGGISTDLRAAEMLRDDPAPEDRQPQRTAAVPVRTAPAQTRAQPVSQPRGGGFQPQGGSFQPAGGGFQPATQPFNPSPGQPYQPQPRPQPRMQPPVQRPPAYQQPQQPAYQAGYQPAGQRPQYVATRQTQPVQQATAQAAPTRQRQLFSPAQIIARVGTETILAGDILGNVNQILEPYEGKAPEDELEKQRQLLMRQALKVAIETKLIYFDFLREIPAENVENVKQSLSAAFTDTRLPQLMKRAEVESPAQLDAKFRKYGTSVAKARQVFFEQVMAQQKLQREIDQDPEVTHQEMLDYYKAHQDEYKIKSKARWEHLMASYAKFDGNRDRAYKHLAAMGNEVLGGAPLEAVAKRTSHGVNADRGGFHDWTTRGSLASEKIDAAIFSLPLDQLSQPIEDDRGYHIVRVVERNPGGYVSFLEAQVGIKEKIQKAKMDKQREAYLTKVRSNVDVWTIFDNE